MMIYKVNKLLFMDLEKEEAWLNEMASKGYNFIYNYLWTYLFEKGTPREYVYRIELLEHKASSIETQSYIDFLEETGVELVSTSGRWAYFRKKADECPFELYTDSEARISHYRRNISFLGFILAINLSILTLNTLIFIKSGNPGNIAAGGGTLFFAILLIRKIFDIWKKIKKLTSEKQIHE